MAWSVASACALMWAARASSCFASNEPVAAVQWASAVVLISTLYYLAYHFWLRCVRKRRADRQRKMGIPMTTHEGSAYTDVPQIPPPDIETESSDGHQQQDHQARPHLTATSVYIYVYGWGLLLFVCLYCASGLFEASSCWWVVGMMTLCLDELIMRGVGRGWVATIGFLLLLSVSSVWWNASGSMAIEMNLGDLITEVVFPVLSPLIFFSLKSSVRAVVRDVYALCEVALPFMVIISISVMVGSIDKWSVEPVANHSRRAGMMGLDAVFPTNASTIPRESHAHFATPNFTKGFHNGSTHDAFTFIETSTHFVTQQWERTRCAIILLGSPVIAGATLLNLVSCVVNGFVAEFLSSFLLVLSVKFAATHPDPQWAVVGICYSGVCFILLILRRKTL